jgi:hypothetical protein
MDALRDRWLLHLRVADARIASVTAPTLNRLDIMSVEDRHVVDEIVAPALPQTKYGVKFNEGYRFVCLGETGSGKTSLMRVVVYSTINRGLAQFALIHDTKGIFPEYRHSVICGRPADFVSRGGFHGADVPLVSFRGDPRKDIDVSAEEVAKFSLDMARKGVTPHLTVIEEMSEAATAGRKHLKAPSVLKLLEQGRKMGVSLVGTTQSPRKVPLDVLGQASSIAFFRLTGADANYLGERLDLDPTLIATVRGPRSEGLPNHKFVLYVKGKPWDGRVYSLDKRTALMFE